jgi:hypothetical protein
LNVFFKRIISYPNDISLMQAPRCSMLVHHTPSLAAAS